MRKFLFLFGGRHCEVDRMEFCECGLLVGRLEADMGKSSNKGLLCDLGWNPGEGEAENTPSLNIGPARRLKEFDNPHWPRHRPTDKCPLYRFEDTGQLLHSAVGSNQVGCSYTWPRSLPRETNSGATKEIPALNQSWRGCDHPTSNWPYQGHQVPYLVPRTTGCLSPLWSNIKHWPYAPGVCNFTGMLWWILHSWLIESPLWDNSRDLHCGIPTRSGIFLSDMNGQIFYAIHRLNHPRSDGIC